MRPGRRAGPPPPAPPPVHRRTSATQPGPRPSPPPRPGGGRPGVRTAGMVLGSKTFGPRYHGRAGLFQPIDPLRPRPRFKPGRGVMESRALLWGSLAVMVAAMVVGISFHVARAQRPS